MPSFLERVARDIIVVHPDLRKVWIVLPSRRAAVFLREELGKIIEEPIWSPRITTSEDFVLSALGWELADQATLIFKLYESYSKVVPEPRESFTEFSHWGMLLLADYNEIDRYLVDQGQLFSYLADVERIKKWDLKPGELTEMLQNYLKMWESLPEVYAEFSRALKLEKRVYQGLAYREVAEKLDLIMPQIGADQHKICFVGFNALNKAEEKIFHRLYQEGLASFYWDVDHYYFTDRNQEAGLFLRNSALVKELLQKQQFNWISNDISTGPKHIRIIATNGDHQQALAANRVIADNAPEDQRQIALVMADEKLLPGFLNNLSGNIESLNITMGLPLLESSMAGFFQGLLNMLRDQEQNHRHDAKGNPAFHHRNWSDLLGNNLSRLWLANPSQIPEIQDAIVRRNFIFLSAQEIEEWQPGILGKEVTEFFNLAVSAGIAAAWSLLAEIAERLFRKAGTRISLPQPLYGFFRVFNRLSALMEEYPYVQDWQTAMRFYREFMSAETLDLKGDPLQGLQVMGMLETRTLDFSKMVITSLNEGVLPKGRSDNSLIPFEIRRQFGLPTYLDKDAVFAYHFYRLLQRSEDITLIYNGTTEGMNTGEASRFIRQLQFELEQRNPEVRITELKWNFEIEQTSDERIEKTSSVIDDLAILATKGISPTALIDYINDQPGFYRKRVLKLEEADEVEEVAGYDTQGNVVHHLLEEYYKPVLAKPAGRSFLDQDLPCFALTRPELNEAVERQLMDKSGLKSFDTGKNLIIREILTGMIERFLKAERAELRKLAGHGEMLHLEGLEETHVAFLLLRDGSEVKIIGNIDRVDRVNGQVRIIDYKTGAVDDRMLSVKDWSDLRQPKDGNKSLQLMVYAWLYMKNNPDLESVQAGIISLRDTASWLMPLKCMGSLEISRSMIDEFELFLKQLLEEIFDAEQAFDSNPVTLQSDD